MKRLTGSLPPILVLLACATLWVWIAFGTESLHTDNQYNLGLIGRSALESSEHVLESSYLHWYFDDREIVRPEDWHRSYYLVAHATVAKLTGVRQVVGDVSLLIALGILAILVGRVARCAQIKRGDHAGRAFAWALALTALLLSLNRWAPELIASSWRDDVPASACALGGILVLTSGSFTVRRAALAGALSAAAFSFKDFHLITAPVFLAAGLAALVWVDRERRPRVILIRALVYLAAFAVFAAPRVASNLADLSVPLPDQARMALNGRLIDGLHDGEHELYAFDPDLNAPESWAAIVRERGLVRTIGEGSRATLKALDRAGVLVWFAIVGTLAGLALRRSRSISDERRRLEIVFFVLVAAYLSCFALSLGEPSQLRYWLPPFVVGTVLGVTGLITLLTSLRKHRKVVTVAFAALTLILVVEDARDARSALRNASTRSYSYTAQAMEQLRATAGDAPVILHTNSGVAYWAAWPQARVVGLQPWIVADTDPARLRAVAERYGVRAAMFSEDPYPAGGKLYDPVSALLDAGFEESVRTDGYVILVR